MENEQKIEAIPELIYDNGLLTFVNYLNFKIQVKSYNVNRPSSTKKGEEIGWILECYRRKRDNKDADAEQYLDTSQKIIDSFLEHITYPFSGFIPDYLQVISSSDKKRGTLIVRFSEKLVAAKNLKDIDFSKSFSKIKNDSAAKKSKEEVNKMWTYEKPSEINIPVENILVIEDTIDSGNTLCVFIDKLAEKGIINNQTTIKAIIIYNNYKDPNHKPFSLEDYKAHSIKK
jgi:hypoxanthine phosphoribosyltransferase